MKVEEILPSAGQTLIRLNLDSLRVLYKRLSVAGRQQAEFTSLIFFVGSQVIRMLRQSQMAENESSSKEGDCESAFHQIRNFQI